MERPLQGKVAVVTGNSRGIGAGISLSLAEAGANIVGSHVDPNKEARALKINSQIEAFGVKAKSVVSDVTEVAGRKVLLAAALSDHPQGVDILVLNAAGGLEQNKPADWADTINRKSQLALVDEFLPHMKPGGAVMYITSLWAHRYGEVQQLPGYDPVARTKKAGEEALRARIPELAEKNIRLLIECGHIISGTAAYSLFRMADRDMMANLEKTAEGGKYATPEDMGKAARDLILSDKESGSIVFVGGSYAEPKKESQHTPFKLDREQVAQKLPMYGPDKLLVDEFDSLEDPKRGVARYTVKPSDCEGHFGGDFSSIQLFRGVDQVEAAAQALGLTWLASNPDSKGVPVFQGVEGPIRFDQMVFPGDQISINAQLNSGEGNSMKGDAEIMIGETIVSRMKGIEGTILPNMRLAMRIIGMQRNARQNPS